MPVYEYLCRSCSSEFALLQPISIQSGETVCPECGGRDTRRLLSTFASKKESPSEAFGGGGSHSCGGGGCGCG